MSAFFPHVDIPALQKFAATAAAEHQSQTSRSFSTSDGGKKNRKGKGKSKGHSQDSKVPYPQVAAFQDIVWAGERVRTRFDDGRTRAHSDE